MTGKLTTDAELADQFRITLAKLHELRKRHNWPHVKLGRFEFRFTERQIEQIVAIQAADTATSAGLTRRSANRKRSA